jgi:hypothetical protein
VSSSLLSPSTSTTPEGQVVGAGEADPVPVSRTSSKSSMMGMSVHVKAEMEGCGKVVSRLVGAPFHQIGHRVAVGEGDGAVGMLDEEAHHDSVSFFVFGTRFPHKRA